jgi:hypothetical protein
MPILIVYIVDWAGTPWGTRVATLLSRRSKAEVDRKLGAAVREVIALGAKTT